MDLLQDLLDSWRINNRINLYLLDGLSDEQLSTDLLKGKAVYAQFAHIQNVRLVWLKASAPDLLEGLEKMENVVDRNRLASELAASSEAIGKLLARSWESGRIKNFKPQPSAFVCYLVAHEANHRGQIELALRQAGVPLSEKLAYGLWEWGTR